MTSASTADGYVGRARETAFLDEVLDRICDGHGRVVRLDGEPGMGKTVLLDIMAAGAGARGITVLRTRGTESEQHLSFAALHRLLQPLLARVDDLPPGQRSALRGVFGLDVGTRIPDRFVVGLAVLELAADAASRSALLLVVDDRQWLDSSTLDIVEFVGQRLDDLPIGVVFAQREPDELIRDESARLHVTGLDDESATRIVQERFAALRESEVLRMVELSEGNPLALRELTPSDVRSYNAARSQLRSTPRLSRRLQDAFGARARDLPDAARRSCLVAALQDSDQVVHTVTAATMHAEGEFPVDDVAAHLDLAQAAGVLVVDESTVRFRHPLVRAAVIAQSTTTERRRAHEALAAAMPDQPARQACHRAIALVRADEAEAAALDDLAEGCQAEGSVVLAHTLFGHAARLSEKPADRNHRLLRLAELAFQMGRYAEVRERVESLRSGDLHPADRARLVLLEMAFDDGVPEGADAVRRFVDSAVNAIDVGQGGLAAGLLVVAARNTYWGATAELLGPEIGDAATRLGATDEEQLLGLIVSAFLTPFGSGRQVMETIRAVDPAALDDEVVALLSQAGFVIGDFKRSLELAGAASVGLRRDGRLGFLAAALVLQSFSALYLGQWDVMLTASEEAERLAAETRQPVWWACARLARANLGGLRGGRTEPEEIAAEVEGVAAATSNAALMNGVQLSRGFTALGTGDPAAACAELSRMFDRDDGAFQMPQSAWAIDYYLEAASTAGEMDRARASLAEMERLVAPTPAPGILRAMSLARLYAADARHIDQRYAECSAVASTAWHRARRDLFYGSWLRRHRQSVHARPLLRSAASTFESLGARSWADRAHHELVAAGARRIVQGRPEAWSLLSAQELQVARLAAQGLTNRDIGARLYLSHRTVSSHLYRLYPKLGITSRTQLHLVLDVDAETG
ncbi:AAA family ATPase [Luteipulveratus flavus]|uniref:LuxR C-terminal-related transcriptional regulator n=1 Tax=Luteipulveratus flavus TaxID=3031728 RepID=A0ABT6CC94_9MICO|nr:LuxR family transcriptional regulator [Luteipulveratus sp. YIM 133296]MDF8266528.1 LuxR C-terminal-related transcriptional regulator [Luteipulveratus sp. YIM 133296]